MREIKFRVWDEEQKEMLYGADFYIDGSLNSKGYSGYVDNDEGTRRECILLQFTGLKDKYDREIYEGDIQLTRFFNSNNQRYDEGYGKVIFSNGRFYLKELNENRTSDIDEYREVIGNIYENSELLK